LSSDHLCVRTRRDVFERCVFVWLVLRQKSVPLTRQVYFKAWRAAGPSCMPAIEVCFLFAVSLVRHNLDTCAINDDNFDCHCVSVGVTVHRPLFLLLAMGSLKMLSSQAAELHPRPRRQGAREVAGLGVSLSSVQGSELAWDGHNMSQRALDSPTCTHAHMHTGTHAHRHTGKHAHMYTGTHAHRHTGTRAPHMHPTQTCAPTLAHTLTGCARATFWHKERRRDCSPGPGRFPCQQKGARRGRDSGAAVRADPLARSPRGQPYCACKRRGPAGRCFSAAEPGCPSA
jgi:hypothetical protein